MSSRRTRVSEGIRRSWVHLRAWLVRQPVWVQCFLVSAFYWCLSGVYALLKTKITGQDTSLDIVFIIWFVILSGLSVTVLRRNWMVRMAPPWAQSLSADLLLASLVYWTLVGAYSAVKAFTGRTGDLSYTLLIWLAILVSVWFGRKMEWQS